MKNLVFAAALALLVAAVSNCSGGSGVGAQVERPAQSIRGAVSASPWQNAAVVVYLLDERRGLHNINEWLDGGGQANAETSSDADGRFELSFQAATAPCLIVAHSGQYIEESTGQSISASRERRLYAPAQCVSGAAQSLTLSWLTSMAYGYARHLSSIGVAQTTAVDRALKAVSDYAGFDILATPATDITDGAQLAASLDDALLYGFASAAWSRLTHQLSLRGYPEAAAHSNINSAAFVAEAIDDIAFDGVLNGMGSAGQISVGQIEINHSVYRRQLANALMGIYTDGSINQAHKPQEAQGANSGAAGALSQGLANIKELAGRLIGKAAFHAGETLMLDDILPVITLTGIEQDGLVRGEARVRVFVSHGLPTAELLSINETVIEPGSPGLWTIDTTKFNDGKARLLISSSDEYQRHQTLSRSFLISNHKLAIQPLRPTENSIVGSDVEFVFDVASGLAKIAASAAEINGATVPPSSAPRAELTRPSLFQFSIDSRDYPDGPAEVLFRATDAFGETAEGSVAFIIDNTAPAIEIGGFDPRAHYSSELPIELRIIEDNPNTLALSIGGSQIDHSGLTIQAGQWRGELPLPALETGRYDLIITATDAAGHRSRESASVNIDTEPPLLAIAPLPEYVSGIFTINTNIREDNLASAELSIANTGGPGGAGAGLSWNIANTGVSAIGLDSASPFLKEGAADIALTALDAAGQTSERTARVIIDNTEPVALLDVPSEFIAGTVTISGEITEVNFDRAQLLIGGQLDANGDLTGAHQLDISSSGPFTFDIDSRRAPLAEGVNAVRLVASDKAGHSITVKRELRIDNSLPALRLSAPAGVVSGIITISGSIEDDNLASASLSIAAAASAGLAGSGIERPILASGPFEFAIDTNSAFLSDGDNQVLLAATDAKGNRVSQSAALTIDNTKPEASLAVPAGFARAVVSVSGRIDEANLASAKLIIGGDPSLSAHGGIEHNIAEAGDFQFDIDTRQSPIADGRNKALLRVVDLAGHSIEREAEFIVDNQPPAIELSAPGPYASGIFSIGAHIEESNLAGAVLRIGAQASGPGGNSGGLSWNIINTGAYHATVNSRNPKLEEGLNTIELSVIDKAGNAAERTTAIIIDNSPPALHLVAPAGFVAGKVIVSGRIDESNLDSARLIIGGAPDGNGDPVGGLERSISQSGDFQFEIDSARAPLVEGENTIWLTASDKAGHSQTAMAVLKVDNTDPQTRLDLPAGFVSGAVVISGFIDESQLVSALLNIGGERQGTGFVGGISHMIETSGPFSFKLDTTDAALKPGANAVELVVSDAGGRVAKKSGMLFIDNTPPAARMDLPGGFVSGEARITGTIEEANIASAVLEIGAIGGGPSGVVEHRLDSAGQFQFDIDTRRAPIAEGLNALRLTVTDLAGQQTVVNGGLKVDNTAPEARLNLPAGFVSGAVLVSASITEDNLASALLTVTPARSGQSGLAFPIAGSGSIQQEINTEDSRLAEGLNMVVLDVTDHAGHTARATGRLYIDNTAPVISLEAPAGFVAGTIAITGRITEANLASAGLSIGGIIEDDGSISGAVEHAIDADGAFHFEVDTLRAPLAEGANILRLTATDSAGHRVERAIRLLVDNIPPVVSISPLPAYISGMATVNLTLDERNLDSAVLYIGAAKSGGGYQGGLSRTVSETGSVEISFDTAHSALGEGPLSIVLVATDAAGHRVESRIDSVIDNAAPVLSLNAPPGFVKGTISISGNIVESNLAEAALAVGVTNQAGDAIESGIESDIDEAGPFSFAIDTSHPLLSEGPAAILLSVIDRAGNRVHRSAAINIDNTAPQARLDLPEGIIAGSLLISGYIDDANLESALVQVGGKRGSGGALTGAISAGIGERGAFEARFDSTGPAIADGINPVRLLVTDQAGNQTILDGQVSIDNSAPQLSLTVPGGFASQQIILSGAVADQHLDEAYLCVGQGQSPHLDGQCLMRIDLFGANANLLESDGAFSHTLGLDQALIREGANTIALVARDRAGNSAVSREGGQLINGSSGQPTTASVFLVDRIAPMLSMSAPTGWLGKEIAMLTTRVSESNPDLVFLCIGDGLDPARPNDEQLCAGGHRIAISQFPEQAHALDLRALPAGIGQGRNPISLYARDRAGHITVLSRSDQQAAEDKADAALLVDTIAPEATLSYEVSVSAGEIAIDVQIVEQHLAAATINFYACATAAALPSPRPSRPRLAVDLDLDQLRPGNDAHHYSARYLFDSTRLADGGYCPELVAIDHAGHRQAALYESPPSPDAPPETQFLRIDNTPPRLTMNLARGPTAKPVRADDHINSAFTVSGAITDSHLASAVLRVRSPAKGNSIIKEINLLPGLDQRGRYRQTLATGAAPGALPDGATAIEVVAVDASGHRQSLSESLVIDTLAPQASIGISGAEIAGELAMSVTVTEAHLRTSSIVLGSHSLAQGDSLASGANRISIDTRRFADGAYPLVVHLSDRAGNSARISAATGPDGQRHSAAVINIDNTAPTAQLDAIDADVKGLFRISGQINERRIASATLEVCHSANERLEEPSALSIDLSDKLVPIQQGRHRFDVEIDSGALNDGDCHISVSVSDRAGNSIAGGAGAPAGARGQTHIDNTLPVAELILPGEAQNGVFSVATSITETNLASATLTWPGCPRTGQSGVDFDLLALPAIRTANGYTLPATALAPHTGCLTDSRHTVRLRVIDRAGNETRDSASYVRDTRAARISAHMPASHKGLGYYRGSISIRILISDASPVRISASLDSLSESARSSCSSRTVLAETASAALGDNRFDLDTSRYPDGRYVLCVTAIDSAGNSDVYRRRSVSSRNGGDGFIIDNTRAKGWMGISQTDVRGTAVFRLAAEEENIDSITIRLIDEARGAFSKILTGPTSAGGGNYYFSVPTGGLAEGRHLARLTITDKSGAATTVSARHAIDSRNLITRARQLSPELKIDIDNTRPVVSINRIHTSGRQPSHLVKGTITVTGRARETTKKATELWLSSPGTNHLVASLSQSEAVNYRLNTARFADGDYTLKLVVRDRAGNSAEAATPITIDNTPARLSLSTPTSAYQRGQISIGYSASERHLRSLVLAIGSRRYPVSASSNRLLINSSPLDHGEHTLAIISTDQFGAVISHSSAANLRIDNRVPELVSHSFAEIGRGTIRELDTRRSGNVNVQFTLSDPHSGFSLYRSKVTVVYSGLKRPGASRTTTLGCDRRDPKQLRCSDSSLSYDELRRMGIGQTSILTCQSTHKVIRENHGLVVRVSVSDAAGNSSLRTINLPSLEVRATITGYSQYSSGCY